MHELSLAGAVLQTVEKHAAGQDVKTVSLRVGRLRQVVSSSLEFYFEIVARGGVCEQASLEIVDVAAELHCQECEHRWQPSLPAFRCPRCDSASVVVDAGEEFEVDWIEIEETEPVACTAPR